MSVKDFDKAWEEKEEESVEFKAKGKTYELPPSLPASIPIETSRLRRKYDDEEDIPAEKTLEIAEKLLGEDQVDQLCDDGMSSDELGDIIIWAMEHYQGANAEDDEAAGSGKDE